MCLVEYCLFNPVFIQTKVITLVQKIYRVYTMGLCLGMKRGQYGQLDC